MKERHQLFVEVTKEEKEIVRELSYLLNISQSNIVKALAMPAIHKLAATVKQDKDGIKKARMVLMQRLNGEV